MNSIDIETKDIKNTITNFIVPIVCLIAALVMVFLVIFPQVNGWEQVQTELTSLRTLESQLQAKKTSLDKLIDFESVVSEDLRLFSQALSEEPSVPELLTQIDIIARESGLEVTRLSYSVTDVGVSEADSNLPTYKAVIVNLGTNGTFDQISVFLANLENAARLIEVLSYRFSGENQQESSIYSGTFVLRAPYLFVEPQAMTDIPIALDITSSDFISLVNKIKSLRYYDISIDGKYLELEESAIEEVSDTDISPAPVQESTPEL